MAPVTVLAGMVVGIAVVPDPVTWPESVMVWLPVMYVFVSILRVPSPPLVFTNPLLVRFESLVIAWTALTVMVFVDLVSPVLNVSGTS